MKNDYGLCYWKTNESIDAVLVGLTPSSRDRIATVGGAGCQAFAFLRAGARVTVYDINNNQIDFIKERSVKELDSEQQDRLTIKLPGDIFDGIKEDGLFDKVYLSNILQWELKEELKVSSKKRLREFIRRKLELVSKQIPQGGEIYITDHSAWIYLDSKSWDLGRLHYDFMPSCLSVDLEKSKATRKLENLWDPAVYVKL